MKRIWIFLILFFLSACNSDLFVQPEVDRSQIYYGQTIADLYENFGRPQKAERFAHDLVVYTFSQQDIVNIKVDKIFTYCNLHVYVQNGRVIDWDWAGNNCQFQEKETQSLLLDDFYEKLNYGATRD